jgi:hypothetical protein
MVNIRHEMELFQCRVDVNPQPRSPSFPFFPVGVVLSRRTIWTRGTAHLNQVTSAVQPSSRAGRAFGTPGGATSPAPEAASGR